MRGFERGGGIFLGARSLLTRAAVSAAVCATRRAASAAASAATRRVLAAAAAATASSRRRRVPRRSRRALPARPRGDVARARPPSRATRSRLGSRGARAGAARGAPRGVRGASAGERRGVAGGETGRGVGRLHAASARGGHPARRSVSARGWSSSRPQRSRSRRRGSSRGSPRSTCARGEPPPRREGAPPPRGREAVSRGEVLDGTSSSRWSVTTKPRSPSPVSIQDGTRFGSPARMSRRVRDAPRRAPVLVRAPGV